MRTLLLLILITCYTGLRAQCPQPENFNFSYTYIHLGDIGPCNGTMILGPSYCSNFSWTTPDTSLTTSTLDHYILKLIPLGDTDTVVITTTSLNQLEMEIGILGEIWVTAVYINPDCESDPSNTIINNDLPISAGEISAEKNPEIYIDRSTFTITLLNGNAQRIDVISSSGEILLSESGECDRVNVSNIPRGIYIIEAYFEQEGVVRKKIVL
jgi:hypothetical protein